MSTNSALKMDPNLLDKIAKLPAEIRCQIIRESVRYERSIYIFDDNIHTGMEAIVSPFAGHPDLLAIAMDEFDRVNTFALQARTCVVTRIDGKVLLSSIAKGCAFREGLNFGEGHKIRKLDVWTCNTIRGCRLHKPSPVVQPANITDLFTALPTLFPKLESINFKVVNVGLVAEYARYAQGQRTRPVNACPEWKAWEKAVRMIQLVRLAQETSFVSWKQNHKVHKSIAFLQHSAAVGEDYPGPVGSFCVSKGGVWWQGTDNGVNKTIVKQIGKLCEWRKMVITLE